MILVDGPIAGREVSDPSGCNRISIPYVADDGQHFTYHLYAPDGRWIESSSWVGFESDESIAESERLWNEMYWDEIATNADRSFA